ncbi:hypothetical protein HDU76_000867 [Blyttiomyces sp. JEL0837]|nr:hypothetical protein HDU76_000867 [Blyttiomyces sp. JEL0837]
MAPKTNPTKNSSGSAPPTAPAAESSSKGYIFGSQTETMKNPKKFGTLAEEHPLNILDEGKPSWEMATIDMRNDDRQVAARSADYSNRVKAEDAPQYRAEEKEDYAAKLAKKKKALEEKKNKKNSK